MASRVCVAASACLVASGLLIGGAGGAIALADPEHGNSRSDDTTKHDDSVGDIVRRAFSLDGGDGEKESAPRQQQQPRRGNGRDGQGGDDQPTRVDSPTETKPTETKPTETKPTETKPTETKPTETKPTTTTESSPPPGQPPPNPPASSGGGGGGGQIAQLPRFTPPKVPGMQLPEELTPHEPGGPGVLDAGAGAVAAAPVGPAAPIALPVILAPPVGLGAGAAGAGSGAAAGAPPAMPRAVTAEPPGGRIPSPANAVNKVAVPSPSYRLGYTEYLRTAGLPQVAALAVPGLVGILVLTGAGGLVGYRQAKSGHAVRVGGAARFMR